MYYNTRVSGYPATVVTWVYVVSEVVVTLSLYLLRLVELSGYGYGYGYPGVPFTNNWYHLLGSTEYRVLLRKVERCIMNDG